MTSLAQLENAVGNHEIYLDPYSFGVNHPTDIVPAQQYITNTYNSIGDQFGFKRDKDEIFDKFTGGTVSHVKTGHILNKQMVYVNETDRERINPSNLLQFNRQTMVPLIQEYSTVYGEGTTKVGHNKNHYEDRINPAGSVFGTVRNDPRAYNPNQRVGNNQCINDRILINGPGTFDRGNLNCEFNQTVDKSLIGEIRMNPNKSRLGSEYRNPGYLIDGLVSNPESIYYNGQNGTLPKFNSDSSAENAKYNMQPAKKFEDSPNMFNNIDQRLNNSSMLFYSR